VLLYFERRDASRIVRELAEFTRDDGYLLLSAAEHPLAWSVRAMGWERSEDAPWLHRQRPTASALMRLPPDPASRDDRTPLPTVSALHELARRQAEAQSAARAGNTDLALALTRRVTADYPLDAGAHLQLGLLLKGAGRPHEAIPSLRRARFLLRDESWLAPYSLAVCLEAASEPREALEAYLHAAAVLAVGGPSGQATPEDSEPMLAATALESCRKRIDRLRAAGYPGATGGGRT
jgi:tetratricopeptide (TPR) repeat protein